ncbi:MAG: tetratricopeptide (TPR) repeat protein [Gammaproteobacteria bacterium]|jgi:tetratricopeptide (TPR) repeat protein
MTDNFDLGDHSFPITTQSKQAQLWFDRGLAWCYGFNQEEAIRCFHHTIQQDPECAMGYWGIAYASGPFYNKPWEWYGEQERGLAISTCHEFSHTALRLGPTGTPLEQALIEALCQKYPCDPAASPNQLQQAETNYALRMREVLAAFPDELDAICLTAESLMNLNRWQLWDIRRGVHTKDAHTGEIHAILEHGLAIVKQNQWPQHAGILHFYIHTVEMSPTPEDAFEPAQQLRELNTESGHLTHMATHIDLLCGQYQLAVDTNNRAITLDLKYLLLRGRDEFYLISCLHNYHMKMVAAMFLGQFTAAMAASNGARAIIHPDLFQGDNRYLATTLEGYYSARVHVLVRFGHWQAIVDEPLPETDNRYLVTITLLHYAKAIAYAALGDRASADNQRQKFEQLSVTVPDWHVMANNPTGNILAVAAAMMNGEVEYHAGHHALGYDYLRKASRLSDQLEYSEPWPWMHPPRHALGALLLEQGHVDEAMQHYEDDLGIGNRLPRCLQHPDNIWALHGYVECLKRQGLSNAADQYNARLETAIAAADVDINSSCCCRKNTSECS